MGSLASCVAGTNTGTRDGLYSETRKEAWFVCVVKLSGMVGEAVFVGVCNLACECTLCSVGDSAIAKLWKVCDCS